jgi:hypothetical protein
VASPVASNRECICGAAACLWGACFPEPPEPHDKTKIRMRSAAVPPFRAQAALPVPGKMTRIREVATRKQPRANAGASTRWLLKAGPTEPEHLRLSNTLQSEKASVVAGLRTGGPRRRGWGVKCQASSVI